MNWWVHLLRYAAQDDKNPKFTAVCLIVIGFFFAPALIGIPILIFGIIKLKNAR